MVYAKIMKLISSVFSVASSGGGIRNKEKNTFVREVGYSKIAGSDQQNENGKIELKTFGS